MFRRHRTNRTRWVAAAAVLTLVGGGVSVASPAQAATSVADGFEGNPYDFWTTVDQPGDSLVWLGNHKDRRTGSGAAVFDAPFEVPARIHRPVIVDRPTGGAVWCYAEAWVRKVPGTQTTPRARLGIRSTGASDGIYIDRSTYDLTNTDWGRAAFASFAYQTSTLTVDISVTRGEIFLDDVTVWCNRQIG
ncbi:hypothetical protein ACTMTJ_08390 [Phytohabitans sp. LJ34]|uniref:hypothetical protein n=1 Tax=Phytohabitans sp. LJ34 TaxID=3452217 RepID=UPI003F8BE529